MRKFIINVNGNSYEVEVEEVGGVVSAPKAASKAAPVATPAAAPSAPKAAPKAAPAVAASAGQEVVDAPMPGNIWKILVKEGQEVKRGDVLLILEAMKMENEYKSPAHGTIKKIFVKEGDNVESNQVLIVIENNLTIESNEK